MFQISGILKRDEIKEVVKNDGTSVQKRTIYLEPLNDIFPIAININDLDLDLGKIGNQITLSVNAYPFYFQDGKVKRANISYYVAK